MALKWIEVARYEHSPFGGRIDVKGITIGDRQQIIERKLRVGMDVGLLPEPDNEHDPNAVAVMLKQQQIGYIERRVAEWLVTRIDSLADNESCHGEVIRISPWEPDDSDEVILLPSIAVVFSELQEVTTNSERLGTAAAAGTKQLAEVASAGIRSVPGILTKMQQAGASTIKAFDSIVSRFAGDDATLKWILRCVALLIVVILLFAIMSF